MQKLTTYFICILCISNITASAQESVATGGGQANGSNGSSSFSVGQLQAEPIEGDDAFIIPGVQQAFEISSEAGLEDLTGVNLTLTVFPNPATEILILDVDTFSVTNLTYRLFDQEGSVVKVEKISNIQTRIPTGNLPKATYFLRVLKSDELLKTFKIVKN